MKELAGKQIGETEIGIYRRINHELWRSYERGEIDSPTLMTERFERFVRECGIAFPSSILSGRYRDYLKMQGTLLPGAPEILERFASTHTMVLITNGFAEIQRSRLSVAGIEDLFDEIIISEEVGVQKPDERIFEMACEAAKCTDRRSALMIGDSPTSDIVGAERSGIDSCLVQFTGGSLPSGVVPTYTIRSLDELHKIIESR